ncbi:unnamed protein product [Calicophoron daubneyi]|uniref:ES1 protein n=1 Tax=Calicophoron daubneyi TaxID=300641 RepID=A0AAV2TZ92_CALDB
MDSEHARFVKLPVKCRTAAVILHGCGRYDGAETSETISLLIHLCKNGVKYSLFAPDMNQRTVVNHFTRKPMSETRNVLVESARHVDASVAPLRELEVTKFDALLVPGGHGATVNLSDFDEKRASCVVLDEFRSIVKAFHDAKKPMGFCCISSILLALCLPDVEISFGSETDKGGIYRNTFVAEAAKAMGAKHVEREPHCIHVDEKNKLVTAPCYMFSPSTIVEVFDEVGRLVDVVIRL